MLDPLSFLEYLPTLLVTNLHIIIIYWYRKRIGTFGVPDLLQVL
jgi:hypothetical protein